MRVALFAVSGLFAAITLSSCASTGVNVTAQQVQTFHKGSTTYAEVVSRLGNPSAITSLGDGSRVAIYSYGHYQTRAASFIPIVGLFAGGGDIHATAAAFTFGPDGILKDWTLTEAAQGVVTGVGAGSMPEVPVRNRAAPVAAAASNDAASSQASAPKSPQQAAAPAKPKPAKQSGVVCITCQ